MDIDGSDDTQPSSVGFEHQHMPELISDGGNSGLSGEDDSTPDDDDDMSGIGPSPAYVL